MATMSLTGKGPVDESNTSLEMETSFLARTGREPSNDEIMEYLDRHKLQLFLTDVIMYVARHFPSDPFEFILNNIEAMVMKHRASQGKSADAMDKGDTGKMTLPKPSRAQVSEEQRCRVVRFLSTALHHDGVAESSATKLFSQFASSAEKLTDADFGRVMEHLQTSWGLQADDTVLMGEILKRWRYRSNAARGTRGYPLWPFNREDFCSAFPSLLRSVRDRYVPIGGRLHKSLFVGRSARNIADKYDRGARLGRGAFGEVFLVTLKATGDRRVCKQVARQQQKVPQEELAGEVDLLRALDHPHIIRLFEYFETEDKCEMIMEAAFGGTLTSVVDGFFFDRDGNAFGARPDSLTEAWVATVFSQLLSALVYAHEIAGVVHKDLKCDNVLLVAPPKLSPEEVVRRPIHAMLADFGIAEAFATIHPFSASLEPPSSTGAKGASNSSFTNPTVGYRSARVGGTPSYMSPEMFRGSFTEKSDIWSLGVMAYQVMTGELPYRSDNLLMQAQTVCNPRRHPRWETMSAYKWSLGARWFCQQLLSKDEAMRPSASEASRDPWITKAAKMSENVPPDDTEREELHSQHLRSHLAQVACHCVVSQLSLSQLHHLNLRFKQYDTSGDGRLNHVEMRQVLEDVGIKNNETIETVIESLDCDHSGVIEYSEFAAGCIDISSADMRGQLRVVFGIFDLDGSGSISASELEQVLTEGPNSALIRSGDASPPRPREGRASVLPDGKTVEEVLRDLDAGGDQQVSYEEFERYIMEEHEKTGAVLHEHVEASKMSS